MWPYVKWVEPEDASGEVAEFYEDAGTAYIMRCLSLRPDFGKIMNSAARLISFSDGALPRRDHELIATFVSSTNRCPFCVDSHAAMLQNEGEADDISHAIYHGDLDEATRLGLPDSRRALLELARKLSTASYAITLEDTDAVRKWGYTEEQIAEAMYVAALFAFFNRIANGFGIPTTNRFSSLGEGN